MNTKYVGIIIVLLLLGVVLNFVRLWWIIAAIVGGLMAFRKI